MSKTDGESRELYEGETEAFWKAQAEKKGHGKFRIERQVERRVSSGHKIVYKGISKDVYA